MIKIFAFIKAFLWTFFEAACFLSFFSLFFVFCYLIAL